LRKHLNLAAVAVAVVVCSSAKWPGATWHQQRAK